jgi:hypothetical protein
MPCHTHEGAHEGRGAHSTQHPVRMVGRETTIHKVDAPHTSQPVAAQGTWETPSACCAPQQMGWGRTMNTTFLMGAIWHACSSCKHTNTGNTTHPSDMRQHTRHTHTQRCASFRDLRPTCSHISPAVRWPSKPMVPVEQNLAHSNTRQQQHTMHKPYTHKAPSPQPTTRHAPTKLTKHTYNHECTTVTHTSTRVRVSTRVHAVAGASHKKNRATNQDQPPLRTRAVAHTCTPCDSPLGRRCTRWHGGSTA